MARPLVHAITNRQLDEYLANPSHALGVFGPAGTGTAAIALWLAQEALGVADFENHAYAKHIAPIDGKAIGIETIREIEQFLRLKVPNASTYNRAILVEDSHLLTQEAQNALLKTLEEPPIGTLIILTAHREDALLPTIQSRLQTLSVKTPAKADLVSYFAEQGHAEKDIARVYAMSGGLPELMAALLSGEDHPLTEATTIARTLVGGTAYERLLTVDMLAKQKAQTQDVLFILQQMAHISLQTAAGDAAKRWQRVMNAAYQASIALNNSGQPKLVLTDLMLHM